MSNVLEHLSRGESGYFNDLHASMGSRGASIAQPILSGTRSVAKPPRSRNVGFHRGSVDLLGTESSVLPHASMSADNITANYQRTQDAPRASPPKVGFEKVVSMDALQGGESKGHKNSRDRFRSSPYPETSSGRREKHQVTEEKVQMVEEPKGSADGSASSDEEEEMKLPPGVSVSSIV